MTSEMNEDEHRGDHGKAIGQRCSLEVVVPFVMIQRQAKPPSKRRRKNLANIMSLKTFAISLFIFAFFFWCWALKNTINMEPPLFDWGLVSFGSVLMTSSYILALGNLGKKPMSPVTRILAMSSHVLVALNYLLGAYLGFTFLARPGFGWYCIIFTALWLCIAGLGSRLLDDSGRNVGTENQSLMG